MIDMILMIQEIYNPKIPFRHESSIETKNKKRNFYSLVIDEEKFMFGFIP